MPSHYGSSNPMPKKNSAPKKKNNPSKKMPEEVKKMLRGDKKKSKDDPSGSAEKSIKGFRKMTDREKKLLAQHFEKNPHDKSQKAKMRSHIMKRPEVKSMKGIEKIHRELFQD
jgi:hypothetical protein